MRPRSPSGRPRAAPAPFVAPGPLSRSPAVAPVHAAVQRAPRAAAVEPPRAPLPLVGRGVDDVRVSRIERDVHHPGVLVDLQDGLPGHAPVAAAVEAALLVRPPEVAHRGDVYQVRVVGMQRDAPDMAAVAQPHVGPGFAAVGALVHPVTPRRTLPVRALPGPDPDDRRVALVKRNRADRVGALVLEDGRQRDAVVARLEHAAGRGRDVELDRVRLRDGQVHDPAAHHRRADVAGAQGVELGRGGLGGEGGGGRSEVVRPAAMRPAVSQAGRRIRLRKKWPCSMVMWVRG